MQDLNGLQYRVFILMRFKSQSVQKLRCKLADVAVMIVEEVEMAIGSSQRAGLLYSGLESGARNVVINGLAETLIGDRIIENDIANGLQQLAVRSRRFGHVFLIVFQGFPGLFVPGRHADIEDINAFVSQIDERLLEKREDNGVAALRSHAPQGLHGVFSPQ